LCDFEQKSDFRGLPSSRLLATLAMKGLMRIITFKLRGFELILLQTQIGKVLVKKMWLITFELSGLELDLKRKK
jgi:hypothetical protein